MTVIECPQRVNDVDFFRLYYGERKSVFLAGGIQGCRDWQKEAIEYLKDTDLILYNPRRTHFDINDQKSASEQIPWEYNHLRSANGILFWFSNETIQPIVLFELGGALEREQPIWVGCHPNYSRKLDLYVQCECHGFTNIVDNLEQLCNDIKSHYKTI